MYRFVAALALVALLSGCQTVQSPVETTVAEAVPADKAMVFGTYEIQINGRSMVPYVPYSIASCDRTTIFYLLSSIDPADIESGECGLHEQLVYLLNVETEEIFVQEAGLDGSFSFLVPHGVYALMGSGKGEDPYHDVRYGAPSFLFATGQEPFVYVGTRRLMIGSADIPFVWDHFIEGGTAGTITVADIQDPVEGERILAAKYPTVDPSAVYSPRIYDAYITPEFDWFWGYANMLPDYIEDARQEAVYNGLLTQ